MNDYFKEPDIPPAVALIAILGVWGLLLGIVVLQLPALR
jgi:hypothetical protein